jgi:hypothetical protein
MSFSDARRWYFHKILNSAHVSECMHNVNASTYMCTKYKTAIRNSILPCQELCYLKYRILLIKEKIFKPSKVSY